MNDVGLITAILIGIAAGFIAEKVMGRNHSLITNLIVGVIGAFVGTFLAGFFNFGFSGIVGSLIISSAGAIVLLFLLGLVKGRGRLG